MFGRIYEFFLMKFSMQGAGAQEGGEFFTPPSLVNLIVNFIQPNHGIIHDPACGSGGMFVQTAHFIQDHENKSVNEAITVYGTELKSNNTKEYWAILNDCKRKPKNSNKVKLEDFTEHFKNLGNSDNATDPNSWSPSDRAFPGNDILDAIFTVDEIETVVKSLNRLGVTVCIMNF